MVRRSTSVVGRRQRRRDERTAEILDLAMRLVVAEGFDALTMPRLARDADAAVGALYRYFADKDALVAALQVRAIDAFGRTFASRIDAARGRPVALARIRAAATAWSAFADEDPAAFALVERSLADPVPVLSDASARAVDLAVTPILERCAALIADATDAGHLAPGDARVRAHALWAAMHGAAQHRKRDRLVPPALRSDRVRDALVDALLAGWAA